MIQLEHKTLLEAGVHFGHLTRKWNPRMAPFIFMKQHGIHIIDLNKTIASMQEVAAQLHNLAKTGKKILFVATKKQAKVSVEQVAKDLEMPYVTERWLGGTLTNFVTIRKLLKHMFTIEKNMHTAAYNNLAKKEKLVIAREQERLQRVLQGLANVTRLPAALFIIDTHREHIAVKEARKLGIPVFALVDTNSNPDHVDYPIPGNDDAYRSIDLVVRYIADAIQSGIELYKQEKAQQTLTKGEEGLTPNKGAAKMAPKKGLRVVQGVVVKSSSSSQPRQEKSAAAPNAGRAVPTKSTDISAPADKKEATIAPKGAPQADSHASMRTEQKKETKAAPVAAGDTAVTAREVAALRNRTGAGMMDCKKALIEAGGDLDKAVDFLRKKGQKISLDRLARQASEGSVFTCVNSDHTAASLLVLNCETDFVAGNELFLKLGKDILAVAAAHNPSSIEALQALPLGDQTVEDAIVSAIGTIGEKIAISTYEILTGDVVVPYTHIGSRLGVLVVLKGAKGAEVVAAGRDVAMQIAAMHPIALDRVRMEPAILAREMSIIEEQVKEQGHEGVKAEKIAQGRLKKFLDEHTLLEQPFVKDDKRSVAAYLQSVAPGLTVTAFKRIGVSN